MSDSDSDEGRKYQGSVGVDDMGSDDDAKARSDMFVVRKGVSKTSQISVKTKPKAGHLTIPSLFKHDPPPEMLSARAKQKIELIKAAEQ